MGTHTIFALNFRVCRCTGRQCASLASNFLATTFAVNAMPEATHDDTEAEIKDWFRTINIAGKPLNDQELLNATYSGPFVTAAKAVFSNSSNANMQKWKAFVAGDEKRQAILAKALEWVSKGNVRSYLKDHRYSSDITELTRYFESVIAWIDGVFKETKMRCAGLNGGGSTKRTMCNRMIPTRSGSASNRCSPTQTTARYRTDATSSSTSLAERLTRNC